MDIVSLAVFGGIGLACVLAYGLIQPLFREKKSRDRAQFGGKNDGPPERKFDMLSR